MLKKILSNNQRHPDGKYEDWSETMEHNLKKFWDNMDNEHTVLDMPNLNTQVHTHCVHQPDMTPSNNQEDQPLMMGGTNGPNVNKNASNQNTSKEKKIEVETSAQESKYKISMMEIKDRWKIMTLATGLLCIFPMAILFYLLLMSARPVIQR